MIKAIPADEYHDSPGLSASLAKTLLNKSPLHAWLESPMNPARSRQEASRLDIGTAAHAALLEGLDVVTVCDFDDWRTKDSKAARDEARAVGKIPLLTHQFEQVRDMVSVARGALADCPDLEGIKWEDGKPEQSIFWTDSHTPCRSRLDWLANDRSLIIDYKTTELGPDAWMRSIPKMGYDIQAAFYLRGLQVLTGKQADFVFCVQETEAPYMVYFVGLPPAYLEIGAAKVQIAIDRWQACMERNEWPGYERRIQYAEPPSWALAEVEERMITQETWNELSFRFGHVKPKERYNK
jgi:hypothetical protein